MRLLAIISLFFILSCSLFARFDIEEYKNYLLKNKDMSFEQLLDEYPAGKFLKEAPTNFLKAEYGDSIAQKFELTNYEMELISKHGFMVSERLSYYTFMQALWDVYNKDMPVYISADAILHALHYSFDGILMEFEREFLINTLSVALDRMKSYFKDISLVNAPDIYIKAVNDMDIYITVTERLLNQFPKFCYFKENNEKVDEIMELIEAKQMVHVKLFSETARDFDFSQFTVRGHYTRSEELSRYFKAMIWLGRTEILITNPKNTSLVFSKEDLQRMAILSALISEATTETGADKNLESMEGVLTFLLGRQDNINLWEINSALKTLSLSAYDISDPNHWDTFLNKVLEYSSANQSYLSQVLYSDPFSPEQIELPSVFLLMGQRPIIDGFVTANTTYDNIMYKGKKVTRMIPSTLDILFSLGNDAAIHLLIDELEKYPYSTNLAALRYLIDSYDEEFWQSTTYTNWVNAIRSLNPPERRENLPKFMQTAAWWQKTMNTQLASWAEMRHDFLLYAKQPYTGGITCLYPYGYVEPVPEFYTRVQSFFISLQNLLNSDYCSNYEYKSSILYLTKRWLGVCDTLRTMSEKILNGKEFSEEENNFLNSTITIGSMGCYPGPVGWYPKLHYNFDENESYLVDMTRRGNANDDFIIADVHTIPTDEVGNPVGWVLHAGTGKINMAVITAPTPDGKTRAYIGPVSSYYEFLSDNFKRLTNEEWRKMDGAAPAYRPAFTNLYLAKDTGEEPIGDKPSLFTTTTNVEDEPTVVGKINLSNHPNPFTNTTAISFTIPKAMDGRKIELNIFDIQGNLMKSLLNQPLPTNNYSLIWNGLDFSGKQVPSGIYIYTIKIGEFLQSGKMNLNK